MRSHYKFEIVDDVLCVHDLNQGGMSVTNNIENVVAEIEKFLGYKNTLPIIYLDTEGQWDGVKIEKDRARFIHLNASTQADAIWRIKKRKV